MEITIKASPKEIADLVLAVQDRHEEVFIPTDSSKCGNMTPEQATDLF